MEEYNYTFPLIIFVVFAAATAIQLFYYLFFFLKVYTGKSQETKQEKKPVSVIICARNESENLSVFLPSVLEQDYPDYEVIVVNDCSEDNSFEVLGTYLEKYSHLRVSTVFKDPKFTHFKKFAQFIGIKAAKNEILLFTDADCRPVSGKWIETMTSGFDDKTDFIIGYGGYLPGKGLLNRYIRYDTITIAMQYLGMALRGIPYMGVGRNLSYRRSLFFEKKGFGQHSHLVSGDDDLFVNSNASGKTTRVEYRPDSLTRSLPAKSFKKWVNQKKRHLTTAPYYKGWHKMLLAIEPFSRVLFFAAFTVMCFNRFLLPFVLGIFGLRFIIQLLISGLVQKRLKEPGLVVFTPFFDLFSPFINLFLYLGRAKKKSGMDLWK
jgi:poly-beta-1,6-N-acetyl-D-glucosamine synthase